MNYNFSIKCSFTDNYKTRLIAKQLYNFKKAKNYIYKELLLENSIESIIDVILERYLNNSNYIYTLLNHVYSLLNPESNLRQEYLKYIKIKLKRLNDLYNLVVDNLKNNNKYNEFEEWLSRNLKFSEEYIIAYIKDRLIEKKYDDITKFGEIGRLFLYINWLKEEYNLYSSPFYVPKLNLKEIQTNFNYNDDCLRIYYDSEKDDFLYDIQLSLPENNQKLENLSLEISENNKILLKNFFNEKQLRMSQKFLLPLDIYILYYRDEKLYINFNLKDDKKNKNTKIRLFYSLLDFFK